ncbi:hypothetical protein [Halobacterium litoreum]|uniref:Uncharacterized protein n=1 Tax=Halobacterium litoreum TaxID=2039234 RepID=A0ABD5NGE5_9EURY|nr:hypothetical protein [Halobacterium litoreum]UHH12829.1 hypothetical protein LT972_11755 [Halobacterium litoreum]
MIVSVADGDGPPLGDVVSEDVVTADAESVGDAVARENATVAVVYASAVADPAAVVATVRSRAPGLPVVVVGTADVDADVTCAASDETAVRAAVERAEHIAAYRASVSTLYEACRERALGQPDADVRERRADADRRLDDLPEDSDVVRAALRPEGDDG